MSGKYWSRLFMVCGVLTMAGAANAADLAGYRAGICIGHASSALPAQPVETIRQTVWANLDSAKSGMGDPAVLASSRPAFVWAMETRWACETAAGYLKSGHVDPESVGKCDCFHQRYTSFR